MNRFNEIIANISIKIDKIIDNEKITSSKTIYFNLKIYIEKFIKNWFINLCVNDIYILNTLSTFIIYRIIDLFIKNKENNDDILKQLYKNSNQDIKAIILLLLPYINDEKINVYIEITDLNELILNRSIKESDFNVERDITLNTHFKYTNIGLGLFDKNNKIMLIDQEYGKLIYKILYHNFVSIIETLSMLNGKLYINWLNIYPIDIENYKDSIIFNKTTNTVDTFVTKFLNNDFNALLDYNGLYIGEFYNVYRNIYYDSIKKVKWLIFIVNNEYLIQYLNKIYNFDNFFNFNTFNELDTLEKNKFIKSTVEITNDIELLSWKYILLFFVNSYSNKFIMYKEIYNFIKPFKMEIDNEESDNDFNKDSKRKFNNITNNDILLLLQNINSIGEFLWNYIKESLIIFNSTVYSNFLVKDNKILDVFEFDNINLKNIYNIAKSLSHESISNWKLLPVKYSSLSILQQQNFWKKINLIYNKNVWISLRSNLNIQENCKLTNTDYLLKMDLILESFSKEKYNLVWKYLVYNGLLSDFKVDFKLTDKTAYSLDKHFKKNLKSKDYGNAYYYLTNKQYKTHTCGLNNKTEYLDIIKDQLWYTFYAMDWIAQINFFHHYLNHRVIYITGATGQGKSTQVPKLFLYALKMLDYKNNGKVICTQPRIGPTIMVGNRISDELGVPVKQKSETLNDDIKTDNYYVQLLHSKDKHTKDNCNHLTLKILTDGSLLNNLIRNPILKDEIKQSKINDVIEYSNNNCYDIIIVDEAHEHNTNMDLILTLMRQSCYMNNDIKLVIMSATMDADEPIFRRYYNIINDNLVYPLRSSIIEYFYNNTFLYDAIYLDRRFHIAPPGKSTQHNITEIYEPNSTTEDIVKKIYESSNFGDILIFENGLSEINKRIESLNKIIPSNIIAIPYYSALHLKYKNLIENDLDKNIFKIRTDKLLVHKLWGTDYICNNSVNEGTYDRCIIIATNVAEASITIKNLKFVIDNGFAKVNAYDYLFNTTKLDQEEISEASRKQRKGRVGRVSSGTIYYLYNKGSREMVKPKYKITQENFSYSFIKLLETQQIDKKEENIMDIYYDPNQFLLFNNNYNNNNSISYKKNISAIIKNQFTINNIDNLLYWDSNYYNFMTTQQTYMYRKESGYTIDIIMDISGHFYIVHPFENNIKRNILGKIINNINDKLYDNLLLNLNYKYFLVNMDIHKNSNYNNYYKTEFYTYVEQMSNYLIWEDTSIEDVITVLTSKAYGSLYEVLEILTIIKITNGRMDSLIDNTLTYNYQECEIEFIHILLCDLKNTFSYFNIFQIISYDYLYNKYFYYFKNIVNIFIIDYKKNKINPPKNKYTANLWNLLAKQYNDGLLYDAIGFINCVHILIRENIGKINDPIYNFRNYQDELKKWCKLKNIKYDTIIKYLNKYVDVLIEILTIKKQFDLKLDKDPLEKMELESYSFKKSLVWKNKFEHIIRPFMHGNVFNIGIKCKTHDNHHKTIPISDITRTQYKTKNNIKLYNNSNLIYYHTKKESKDSNYNFEVTLTNKIEIEWLYNVLPFFYKPINFKDSMIKFDKYEKIEGDLYEEFCVKLKNKWTLTNIPFDSTKLPILATFIKNMKKQLLIQHSY